MNAPRLACVVLSVGAQPEFVAAVRSLAAQDAELELLVVNSAGGEPARALQQAGLRAAVIDRPERLLHGAARNVGVLATSAPWIAFLSADCAAEPGWVAARRRAHEAGAAVVASAIVNPHRRNLAAWASHVALFARRMPGTPGGSVLKYGASYERGLFARVGAFREDLPSGEDTEFHQRLERHGVPIAWVPAVRTAHPHPRTLPALLANQYRRGARAARTWRELADLDAGRVAANALRRVPSSLSLAWRGAERGERPWIAAAAPLIAGAALAYAWGALRAVHGEGAI